MVRDGQQHLCAAARPKLPPLPHQVQAFCCGVEEQLRGVQHALGRAAAALRPGHSRQSQNGAEAGPAPYELRVGSPRRRVRLPSGQFAAIIPGDSVAEAVITTGVSQFLSLYNAAIIARLVLTWFPNPPQAIAGPLSTVCDPYLNLFRGIIPPLGGTIDLSPILAFIALDLFSNTAAALPCEVDADGSIKQPKRSGGLPSPARVLAKWQRREAAKRRRQAQSSH